MDLDDSKAKDRPKPLTMTQKRFLKDTIMYGLVMHKDFSEIAKDARKAFGKRYPRENRLINATVISGVATELQLRGYKY